MRRTRLLSLAVLVGMLVVLALPGLAVEETPEQASTTETTVAGESGPAPKPPAVVLVDEPEPEVLQPWTIRYLIPASIVIAGLLTFGTVVQYFLKVVRTRYKTVE
ncbi:MAG: hypothetical protein ACFCVC_05365 [Acidimicrobiia bacterium]